MSGRGGRGGLEGGRPEAGRATSENQTSPPSTPHSTPLCPSNAAVEKTARYLFVRASTAHKNSCAVAHHNNPRDQLIFIRRSCLVVARDLRDRRVLRLHASSGSGACTARSSRVSPAPLDHTPLIAHCAQHSPHPLCCPSPVATAARTPQETTPPTHHTPLCPLHRTPLPLLMPHSPPLPLPPLALLPLVPPPPLRR